MLIVATGTSHVRPN